MEKFDPSSVILPSYCDEDFEQNFYRCWRKKGEPIGLFSDSAKNEDLEIVNYPYNCAFIPNIFQETQLLKKVVTELEPLDLQYKNNDLFKFKCTEDLKGVNKPNIQKLCSYIEGPLKFWIQKVTGLQLNKKVAISSSRYDYSDVLLCHDDELEGRRIAFILYLVPSWEKMYGGSLDLFSVDESNRPLKICQRFNPKFNSLAFFEVSPVSFHQVSEVLTKTQTRVSINGWFHGEPIDYPPRPSLKAPVFILPGEIEEHIIYAWINPLYLDQSTQTEVRKEFKEKSEIQLSDFLKQKKYDQLAQVLQSHDVTWKWAGPPNKRHVEIASRKTIPNIIDEYLTLMESEAMFLILSQLTGLELHHLAPESDSDSDESESDSETEATSLVTESSSKVTKTRSFSKDGESSTNGELSCDRKKGKRKGEEHTKGKKKRKFMKSNTDVSVQEGEENLSVGGLLDVGWESDTDELNNIGTSRTSDGNRKAEVSSEIRRWRWGAYSLMRDDDLQDNHSFLLDAMLFCNGSSSWNLECGGGTVYVAKGEEEELLTVMPVPNSMTLVYRDKETFRFTKHINVKSRMLGMEESSFQEVLCVYREIK